MARHWVDVDEEQLAAAAAELGTHTIKNTVNEALRLAAAQRTRQLAAALDVLASTIALRFWRLRESMTR